MSLCQLVDISGVLHRKSKCMGDQWLYESSIQTLHIPMSQRRHAIVLPDADHQNDCVGVKSSSPVSVYDAQTCNEVLKPTLYCHVESV
jgi:hypothetical protein